MIDNHPEEWKKDLFQTLYREFIQPAKYVAGYLKKVEKLSDGDVFCYMILYYLYYISDKLYINTQLKISAKGRGLSLTVTTLYTSGQNTLFKSILGPIDKTLSQNWKRLEGWNYNSSIQVGNETYYKLLLYPPCNSIFYKKLRECALKREEQENAELSLDYFLQIEHYTR